MKPEISGSRLHSWPAVKYNLQRTIFFVHWNLFKRREPRDRPVHWYKAPKEKRTTPWSNATRLGVEVKFVSPAPYSTWLEGKNHLSNEMLLGKLAEVKCCTSRIYDHHFKQPIGWCFIAWLVVFMLLISNFKIGFDHPGDLWSRFPSISNDLLKLPFSGYWNSIHISRLVTVVPGIVVYPRTNVQEPMSKSQCPRANVREPMFKSYSEMHFRRDVLWSAFHNSQTSN